MAAESWRDRAKCFGLEPDLFILDRGHQPAQAMAVYNGPTYGPACPVRVECKAYAAATGSVGVWGGEYISSRDYGVDDGLKEAILDIGSMLIKIQDARPRPAEE